MKNITFKGALLAVITLTLSSCKDDFFELEAPPENPWRNVAEFDRAAVGATFIATQGTWDAGLVGSHRFYKTILEDAIYWIPGQGGDVKGGTEALYDRNLEIPNDVINGRFGTAYQAITTANNALEFLSANGGNPFPEASPSDITHNLSRIEGELLFIRGLAYHELATIHLPWYKPGGGNTDRLIPLRTTFAKTVEDASRPYIATTEEIWQQVVSDLVKAKSLLPLEYDPAVHPLSYKESRANKFIASFLLAKVYFEMQRYPEAKAELDFIIDQNGGRFDLSEDPIEAWNKNSSARGKEVLWYLPAYDPNYYDYTWLLFLSMNKTHMNGINGGGPASTGGNNSFCPWRGYTMSNSVMKQIGWMDNNLNETPEALADKRYTQLYYRLETYKPNQTPAELALGKWEHEFSAATTPLVWGNKYMRSAVADKSNIPVYRLAEAYLTRAIIKFKQGDISGATLDVNMVRRRAGLPDLLTVTEDQIHNERIKEMSFEGDRIDYLRALGKPIPAGDRDPSKPNSVINYPYANLKWPLPPAELNYNQNLGK